MKILNQFKMQLTARSSNESFARCAVASFISQLDPTLEEISDIKTAVSEAVTNCIVHGYRHSDGMIYIKAKITTDNKVIIKIRDKGCGIADVKKAMEPLFTTAPEEERAGLGFAVMKSFCDKVKVKSELEKGTVVTLEKTIAKKEEKG